MIDQRLKNTKFWGTHLPAPVWRTIFLTLPLYDIVHTDPFEVLRDMVHQIYKQTII